MDDEALLSKIDMQAAAAFRGWMAELIHLHVKKKLSKRDRLWSDMLGCKQPHPL